VLLEVAAKHPDNEVPEPLTERRKAVCTDEVESQRDFELRIFEMKQLAIRFIDLMSHRRSRSAHTLGEFLTQEIEEDEVEEDDPNAAGALDASDTEPEEDDDAAE